MMNFDEKRFAFYGCTIEESVTVLLYDKNKQLPTGVQNSLEIDMNDPMNEWLFDQCKYYINGRAFKNSSTQGFIEHMNFNETELAKDFGKWCIENGLYDYDDDKINLEKGIINYHSLMNDLSPEYPRYDEVQQMWSDFVDEVPKLLKKDCVVVIHKGMI